MGLKDDIRRDALDLGIDRVGFAAADGLGPAGGLDDWLRRSYHGTMDWMARAPERRLDPRRVLDSARTVITIAVNYFQPVEHEPMPGAGRISRYAWGSDYHKLVGRRLRHLLDGLRRTRPDLRARCYVDTGPVLEKAWSHRAGLGWVGKHGNLITRELGSWVFLGEILIDGEIEPDLPATDHCGTCTRCIDACPTAAIVAPTVVDARRCISYLTIEHRTAVDPALRAGQGDWIFGCDVCQDVCPWNKFQQPGAEARFAPRTGNLAPDLVGLARLGREEFDERFRGTNVRRARWSGFLRNVMIALGNSGAPDKARQPLTDSLGHPEPLVRGHAAWALGRVGERDPLRARQANETDAAVRAEIERALAE